MTDLEKGQNRKTEGTANAEQSSKLVSKSKRRSNCLLGFCRLVNFLTAVCALLCGTSMAMAFMLGEGSDQVGLPQCNNPTPSRKRAGRGAVPDLYTCICRAPKH